MCGWQGLHPKVSNVTTLHKSFIRMKATLLLVILVALWHSRHCAKHLESLYITVNEPYYRRCQECLLDAGAIHVKEAEVTSTIDTNFPDTGSLVCHIIFKPIRQIAMVRNCVSHWQSKISNVKSPMKILAGRTQLPLLPLIHIRS